jgi:hypothetical protein
MEQNMRSFILPVAVGLPLATSSVAMAASSKMVDGTIKSIDMKTHSVTMADGTSYMAGKHVNLKRLKLGEKVAVTVGHKGKTLEALKIAPAKS